MTDRLLPDPTESLNPEVVERGTPSVAADGTVVYSAPSLVELPAGLIRPIELPPEAYRKAIENSRMTTPCSMPIAIKWKRGPSAGMPVTLWCAEPLCIDEGRCTGPRFVPHMDQFTHEDPDHPFRRRRALDVGEIIAAVRTAAKLVYPKTNVEDTRTDTQIARFVGYVWRGLRQSMKDDGEWTQL